MAGALALAGCAAGEGPATNGSGNVVINGPLIINKIFGNCPNARSGIQAASDSSSELGGQVGANIATQTGELGGSTAAAFTGALGALDECLAEITDAGLDVEELVLELERLGYVVTPPAAPAPAVEAPQ